jgi:TolB-like protein/Tfp pilus assembly protein PilF
VLCETGASCDHGQFGARNTVSTEEAGAPQSTAGAQPFTATGAVFLSYASEDVPAAERIATALAAAGIEVWFDKVELRGGDAWDRKIRRQIRDCALFVPIISTYSQARPEGYFRLEWDLADQRTHLMGRDRAFVLPVCTDATPQREADVPDSFLAVQWTRLPAGETPWAFVDRVKQLLSPEPSTAIHPAGSAVSGTAPIQPRSRSRHPDGQMRALLVAVAIMAAAAAYFGAERLRVPPVLQTGVSNSVAVLPLANESGDASQQYFSDGLSEDLITALSQFPGLKVIGRTSSFQFRNAKEDSRSIGAKLGVAHLVEGSVRRAGNVVRVSAELINTSDGSTQWSERYDRHYKDLFALQDDITSAVAGALKTRLLAHDKSAAQSDRPPSGNLEAYNALLQGRFYIVINTESDARKAIELYTAATQLDAHYAQAWSELSWAWTGLASGWLSGAPARQAYAKARGAADKALALAPDLAAAHLARAWLLLTADFDWRGAQTDARRALELAPDYDRAKFYLADELATSGQLNQAVELARQALAADPLHANWYSSLGGYLLGLNRLDESEAAVRKAIELQPNADGYHATLAAIAIQRGDARTAMAVAQQEPSGASRDFALALTQQVGGDPAAAAAALKLLIDKHADDQAYGIADIYALRKDPDNMFDWLERAWSNRDSGILSLLYDPLILRYKDDPRFSAFCRKVGLPTPSGVAAQT